MQTLKLPKASLATVTGAVEIVCEQGMIWLTDDGRDIVLQRGETWRVCGPAPVVIEALSISKIRFESASSLARDLQQVAMHCFSKLASPNRRPHYAKTA
jgi:hypothetical protein